MAQVMRRITRYVNNTTKTQFFFIQIFARIAIGLAFAHAVYAGGLRPTTLLHVIATKCDLATQPMAAVKITTNQANDESPASATLLCGDNRLSWLADGVDDFVQLLAGAFVWQSVWWQSAGSPM